MRSGNDRPDLAIYTRSTRDMLKEWLVTPAQMQNIVRTYRECGTARTLTHGGMAVVRYPMEKRRCAPWFLRREDNAWKLDLTMMQEALAFNHDNEWHFRAGAQHDYGFAFDDWRFDQHGFPHAQ